MHAGHLPVQGAGSLLNAIARPTQIPGRREVSQLGVWSVLHGAPCAAAVVVAGECRATASSHWFIL